MEVQIMVTARTYALALGLLGCAGGPTWAQSSVPNPTQRASDDDRGQMPVYRVTVVARTTPAINYRHRSGATKIDFGGTPLLPEAYGEAKVESKQGYIEIEVEFDELEPATMFGPEYLTYVMWAITPEGRATNLGEVLLNGSESKLNVTTELQTFGLVVTAEPYFAVSQPSDVVVLENVVRSDTRGDVEHIEARYELLKRGTYLMNVDASRLHARTDEDDDDDTPLELRQARNAVQLAAFAGADQYAVESFEKARGLLRQAEDAHADDERRRVVVMAARQAAQTAEDARLIALQRQEEERAARVREQVEERRAAAERRRQEAEDAAERAEYERSRLERERVAAERRVAEAEALAQQAARDRADADAARAAAERARHEAELSRERLEEERVAAERARLESEARAEQASRAAAAAEQEKARLRAQLQEQLSVILETRESARGLIVSMPDVLFDTARHTLTPGAREKLAKVAGVLIAYPQVAIQVEGHADSVGDEERNQLLSERRADSVRDYLVRQGVPAQSIVAVGYGESRPIVSNATAAGRQQNRRVELVVSGEAITPLASVTAPAGPSGGQ
jgi:outer membrane protein OmpA-like peptidoglycan-associated protein